MTASCLSPQKDLDAAAEASLKPARALYAWQARIDLLREVDRLRTETAAAIEQARADGAAAEERIERGGSARDGRTREPVQGLHVRLLLRRRRRVQRPR